MYIIWELIGLFVLGMLSIALVAAALLLFGFLGFYNTHDPIFAIPFVLGLLFASALD